MKNKKIKYGKTDLVGGRVRPEEVTIRISIMMEGDLLEALKKAAERDYMPYQTKMKQMLRRQLEAEGVNATKKKVG